MKFKSKYLGRASEYKEEYCDQLIEHMASGLSFESFSAVIGVHRATLYEWVKIHDAFNDAKRIGTDKNLHWWEKQGRDGLFEEKDAVSEKGVPYASRSINTSLWIFNMKNRHLWKDKQDDKKTIYIKRDKDMQDISDEELDASLDGETDDD